MRHVFIVPGYGIPKDILRDSGYQAYLKTAFRAVCARLGARHTALVILSGGPTGGRGGKTEASEMRRFARDLSRDPRFNCAWERVEFAEERRSLSSLENLLFARELMKESGIRPRRIATFCELTRKKRIKTLARKIFRGKAAVDVLAVDFDRSPDRYLETETMRMREWNHLKFDLWALKSPENLASHRSLVEKRLRKLRQKGVTDRIKTQLWWSRELRRLLSG